MRAKRAMGWGVPGLIGMSSENVNVHVCGVCTCSWRKEHCEPGRRCAGLFADGGEMGANATLKRLMGGRLPRHWTSERMWKHPVAWKAKAAAFMRFERERFEACRPVTVEVRSRG